MDTLYRMLKTIIPNNWIDNDFILQLQVNHTFPCKSLQNKCLLQ